MAPVLHDYTKNTGTGIACTIGPTWTFPSRQSLTLPNILKVPITGKAGISAISHPTLITQMFASHTYPFYRGAEETFRGTAL